MNDDAAGPEGSGLDLAREWVHCEEATKPPPHTLVVLEVLDGRRPFARNTEWLVGFWDGAAWCGKTLDLNISAGSASSFWQHELPKTIRPVRWCLLRPNVSGNRPL